MFCMTTVLMIPKRASRQIRLVSTNMMVSVIIISTTAGQIARFRSRLIFLSFFLLIFSIILSEYIFARFSEGLYFALA